jgi:hypothetical protein
MLAYAGGDAPPSQQELEAAQFEMRLQQRLEEQQQQVMQGKRERELCLIVVHSDLAGPDAS